MCSTSRCSVTDPLRLESETIEELDEEAEEEGFANRTEYIRWMIRNRESLDPNTVEKLSEYEERLERLEEEVLGDDE